MTTAGALYQPVQSVDAALLAAEISGLQSPTDVGSTIGDGISAAIGSSLDPVMQALWAGCLWLLRESFILLDEFSTFSVDPHGGSVGPVWPLLVSVATAIALGLFFWQLTIAALRGGRGMLRAASGPVAYGIALAVTAGMVAVLVESADGVTTLLLSQGLQARNFSAAFTATSIGSGATNGVKTIALGLIGFFGLLPAALGYIAEIIWRQAAILVLVATVPITAAGLLAESTAGWFWKACRWITAAIVVKPALALILVIGFSVMANATGVTGFLAGVGVLWVSLTAPLALYRLLAFVDPGTDPGGAFRHRFTSLMSRLTGLIPAGTAGDHGGYAGFDASPSGGSGGSGDGGGVGAFEAANTSRFDSASAPESSFDAPAPPPAPGSYSNPADAGSGQPASADDTGDGSSPPEQPGQSTGPGHGTGAIPQPASGSAGGAAAGAAEAGEAGLIL